MKTQTIKACWHTHAPLPPLFDWGNKRYIRAIDLYLENLKKEGINALAITTHHLENLRNPKLKDCVSFLRGNINPKTIYKIVESRAKLKKMITFPALEVETFLCSGSSTKVHLGIVHWDENKIYHDFSLYQNKTLEELLQLIPKECLLDIKHPWYQKRGVREDKTYQILKQLIDKYHLFVEKNGLAAIAYIFIKHLFKLFPLLKKNKFFKRKFLEIKKSINLEGFKNSAFTCGSDAHLGMPLPKGGGYIELKLNNSSINKRVIIESIKQGQGKVVLPDKMSFWSSFLVLLKSFFALRKEGIILSRILLIKIGLRKKIYWECLKSQPNYKKIIKWLTYLNEGFKINSVLPQHLISSLDKKQFQNRFILNFQKFISMVWERKFAISMAAALFFLLRKIIIN